MKKSTNRIAFFNILSVLLLQGISLISSPLFSRLLGTDGYGNLSSYTAWSSILSTVFSLQTAATIVHARTEYGEEEQAGYQSSVLSLSLLSFGVLAAVVLLFLSPISNALALPEAVVLLMVLQALGSFLVGFLSSKFTYEFSAGRNMLLSTGMAVATLVIPLLLVLNRQGDDRYFGRVLGDAIVYGAVGVSIAIWILRSGKVLFSRRYWRFCLMLSLPLVFQNLSYLLLGNSDILMLKQMTGESDAGIYTLGLKLGGLMFTIFTALNNTWVPFFFDDMKQGSREPARQRAENFLELFTILSMGFVLLVPEVFHIYAPEDFWSGTRLIPLFVIGYYLNFLCTFPVNYELFHKKTAAVSAATVAAALINLGLNYWLISVMGMPGAAVATCASHAIQYGIHLVYSGMLAGKQRDYPIGLLSWGKYTAAFGTSVAVFYLLPDHWLLRWGAGACLGLWELLRIRKRKSLL